MYSTERDDVRDTDRRTPVLAHRGNEHEFQQRLQDLSTEAITNSERRTKYFEQVFACAIDPRNLKGSWDFLKRRGGQAPGVDGMTFQPLPSTTSIFVVVSGQSSRNEVLAEESLSTITPRPLRYL